MMPNDSGKFVRLDCGDEIDVDLNGETVTFRRVKGARFEIVAHKRVGVGKVRKRIKPKPRLQPNQREKVAISDESRLQS